MQVLVQGRVLILVAAVVAAFAGWSAVHAGSAPPAAAVAGVRVGAAEIPAAALAAGPDRAIERRWLEGEAAARGLPTASRLNVLRGQVADAIAGRGAVPSARALARRFGAFHARWRARTRCGPEFRDPHADRCGDVAPAATGVCRWLGAATVCDLAGGRWLVVAPGGHGRPGRYASRGGALGAARRLYLGGRRARARERAVADAEARALADEQRRATARRAAAGRRAAARRRAQERERAAAARARDPRLSPAVLSAGKAACARQATASEPYLFAFGLQDVVGQADGLIAARADLARRLRRAAAGADDRRRLAPLLAAIAAGSRELGRLAAADLAGDRAAVEAGVARFDDRTAAEQERSRRLGLGDCLVRPAA